MTKQDGDHMREKMKLEDRFTPPEGLAARAEQRVARISRDLDLEKKWLRSIETDIADGTSSIESASSELAQARDAIEFREFQITQARAVLDEYRRIK